MTPPLFIHTSRFTIKQSHCTVNWRISSGSKDHVAFFFFFLAILLLFIQEPQQCRSGYPLHHCQCSGWESTPSIVSVKCRRVLLQLLWAVQYDYFSHLYCSCMVALCIINNVCQVTDMFLISTWGLTSLQWFWNHKKWLVWPFNPILCFFNYNVFTFLGLNDE